MPTYHSARADRTKTFLRPGQNGGAGLSVILRTPDDGGDDGVKRLLQLRLADARRRFSAAVGKRVEIEFRKHFASRPKNKRGWPSKGFWRRRIRNATALTAYDETSATVTIADPAMNQKVHGGPIVPREGKFLTVPARPEANGRSPRTFGNLVFIPLPDFRQGRGRGKLVGLLVEKNEKGFLKRTRGVSRDGKQKTRLKVFYYCMASVYQGADPQALPDEAAVQRAIEHEGHAYLQREINRGGLL